MPDPFDPLRVAEMTRAGLEYIERGWKVFVLGPGKVPLPNCRACRAADSGHDMEGCPCSSCHGFYAATDDPDRAIDMVCGNPDGLLAVRTGAASGLVVVDVDPRNGGDPTYRRLLDEGALPTTLTARTGSGGVHLYYAHPGGVVKSGANRLGDGVDVKADSAYVVAPPSAYDDKAYTWSDGEPSADALAPLESRLAARLAPREPRRGPVLAAPVSASGFTAPSNAAGRLAGIVTVLLSTPEGARNDVLNWAAYTSAELVRERRAPLDAVVATLSEAAAAIGLAPSETRGTIRSGLRAGGVV